ncbi:MAG: hypothetical protein ACK56L_03505, partial [Pseudanabaena sp.]
NPILGVAALRAASHYLGLICLDTGGYSYIIPRIQVSKTDKRFRVIPKHKSVATLLCFGFTL